eukprot:scaffold1619_cov292-Pavlova_lutheri.AAC.15
MVSLSGFSRVVCAFLFLPGPVLSCPTYLVVVVAVCVCVCVFSTRERRSVARSLGSVLPPTVSPMVLFFPSFACLVPGMSPRRAHPHLPPSTGNVVGKGCRWVVRDPSPVSPCVPPERTGDGFVAGRTSPHLPNPSEGTTDPSPSEPGIP